MSLDILAKVELIGDTATLTRHGWMCSDRNLEDVLDWDTTHPPFVHSPIWWKDLAEFEAKKWGGKVLFTAEHPGSK